MADVIEIYDTEIIKIQAVRDLLAEKATRRLDRGLFDQEIKERFYNIGFNVDVKWWHTDVEDIKIPEIEIVSRVDKGTMDHDRLRHEIVNDVLGLGEGGVIKTGGADEAARIRATIDGHKKHAGSCEDAGHNH